MATVIDRDPARIEHLPPTRVTYRLQLRTCPDIPSVLLDGPRQTAHRIYARDVVPTTWQFIESGGSTGHPDLRPAFPTEAEMHTPIPLVLVHGIRLSSACWRQQERLLAHREIVCPDLPGHGSRRGEEFLTSTAVDTVSAAIDQLGGSAVVVGHSLGGYVAIATAARHPNKVAGLVGFGCTLEPNAVLLGQFQLAYRGLSALPDHGDRLSASLLMRMLPSEVADPVITAGFATEVIPSVITAAKRVTPISDLRRYSGPTRLVTGSWDHFRLGQRRFVSASARGSGQLIRGAGHYLPFTHGLLASRIIDGAALDADIRDQTE